MKAVGIDFGAKNIGISITYHGDTATPLSVIPGKPIEQAISMIRQIVDENEIDVIVIGIPFSLSGGISSQTKKALDFEKLLRKRLNVEIQAIDERLTTKQAEDMLIKYSPKRAKEKSKIDKYSAALILQSYLDLKKQEAE